MYRMFTSTELLDKLMEAVEQKDTIQSVRVKGKAGIAVDKDELARRWQQSEERANNLHRELRRRLVEAEAKEAVR